MSRDSIIQVVARTMNILETEFGVVDLRDMGMVTAVDIADMIFADPTLPEGKGSMLAPSESPRQGRDRINGFKKD